MEEDMDLSFTKDAPAAAIPAEDVERTQWEQEHRRHQKSERPEAEEVEKEEREATQAEENTDGLPAASASTSASVPFPVISNPTQLAIFFDGAICVYDDIPLEKFQAILLIAAATAAAARTASPGLATSPSLQISSASPQNQQQLLANTGSSICKLQAELPLARRNSLQRFLEKRRDRLVSRAPYPPIKSTDSPGSVSGSDCSTPDDLC